METLEVGMAAVFGLLVAPLLRVLIDDIPKRPLSAGTASDLKLALSGKTLWPVVSWFQPQPAATLVPIGSPDLVEEGEQRPVTERRWRAPVLDLITAGLLALVVSRFGIQMSSLPLLVFTGALIVASTIDIDHYRLPDRLTFPAFVVCASLIVVASLVNSEPRAIVAAFSGAIAYFLFLFIFFVISPSGMGFGDVKLALLLGLVVGWVGSFSAGVSGWYYHGVATGMRLVLMSGLFGSVLGTLVGLSIIPFRGRKAHFPFGPSLCMGAFLAVIFSRQLM